MTGQVAKAAMIGQVAKAAMTGQVAKAAMTGQAAQPAPTGQAAQPAPTGQGDRPGAIGWAVACAMSIAGYHLSYKAALREAVNPSACFVLSLGISALINVGRLGTDGRRAVAALGRRRWQRVLIMGLVCSGSFLILMEALAIGGSGYVLTLRNTSVLFAVVPARSARFPPPLRLHGYRVSGSRSGLQSRRHRRRLPPSRDPPRAWHRRVPRRPRQDRKINQTTQSQILRGLPGGADVDADADCDAPELRLSHFLDHRYNRQPHEALGGQTPLAPFKADTRALRFPADDMDSRLVLSLVIAGQSPVRALLARDDQEAMARRIAHYAQLRLLSREELAQYVAHRCAVAGAARVPFDERTLDALFEIGRGNLRTTDDLALKSLDYAAAAGHATASVQHVIGARKDLWP
jgi:uncharacterized membrane protein